MVNRRQRIAIQNLARSTLIERGMMALPVDPRTLAKAFDIEVHPFDFGRREISGCLMNVGSSFAIGYSTSIKSQGFQNFTIGHELGHYLLPGHFEALLSSGHHYSQSSYISADPYEEEADTFAAELLMPWKLIEAEIRAKRPGFESIKTIAESCGSSLLSATIRFCEYTTECAAAIVSFQGKVEFMTASASFKELPGLKWLQRGDNLPAGVPSAARGIDDEWISTCEVDEQGALLNSWFPDVPRLEVEEDIVGLGNYGRILTVLLADWNSEEEEEEESTKDEWIDRWSRGHFRGKK